MLSDWRKTKSADVAKALALPLGPINPRTNAVVGSVTGSLKLTVSVSICGEAVTKYVPAGGNKTVATVGEAVSTTIGLVMPMEPMAEFAASTGLPARSLRPPVETLTTARSAEFCFVATV